MTRPNWFIALPVRAAELPAGLLGSLPAGIRRFHPEDLHVTVAFLGPVTAATARTAWAAGDWSRQPPLATHTGPRAGFGHPRRPSAYGLEIGDGDDPVAGFLRRWREPLLAAAGRPPETRPVRPHLTLGRPPRRHGDTIRARARDWVAAEQPPVALQLDRIALYTRAPERGERLFTRVRECTFGGD